jgi:outer membrane protein OmpA-like peptidoglycan-associated protein
MKVHPSLAPGLIVMLVAACATPPSTTPQASATPPATQVAATPAKPAAAAADSLQILFGVDSASLSPAAGEVIDHAARLFREGNPVVMTVAGHSDRDGAELANLLLSGRRAAVVKDALVARGIPADRLELVAYGVAEPAVPANPTAAENRRVVISWR